MNLIFSKTVIIVTGELSSEMHLLFSSAKHDSCEILHSGAPPAEKRIYIIQ
jgi:hypothetical protein